ncbi:NAD-glutamate dehydrogenase [Roseomonas sp. GC11]|uniref:NAD-glutamate dehydrogenase domain-containing protein n=1 Tax=Roseomonas sp. GC11 TaxID=2950546 RepID=UPI002108E881|nr:NAD-glutamate dehydrogenase domain-containing protein [Roseomonas sp. GC11]MCQ4162820.1 NAD-glutamate dehydrogenase [Roseomonas sp. GC11]
MPEGQSRERGARAELLRAAEEALRQQAPALPESAAALLHHLAEGLPTAELATEPPERLAAAAASLYAFAAARKPGTAKVRIVPPGPGRGAVAVAEIVTDDMPFLVDSVLAALTLSGRTPRRLLHPVLRVARDAAGQLSGFAPEGAAESMMHVEIAPAAARLLGGGEAPAEGWEATEAALQRAMAEVRRAVEDYPAILAHLRAAEGELAAAGHEAAAGQAFLRWMAEDNFVFLGHRLIQFGEATDGAGEDRAGEHLGLLRDEGVPVFDALRDLSAIPPAVRASLLLPVPLSIAKANMRARVHRPQHADVVATRILDAAGHVTGVRLFLGLFAASAYNRNPRSIPWLSAKVERILARAGVNPDSHDGRALRNILDTWPRDELFQADEASILEGAHRALDLFIRPRPALSIRRDPFERFVSAIAWLPRDTFDTRLREKVGAMLARAFAGRLSAFHIALGDTALARVHYIIGTTPGALPPVDDAALEAALAQAARPFTDRLGEALTADLGEARAAATLARWTDAFPAAYAEAAAATTAVADLQLAEAALAAGRPAARIERLPGEGPRALTLRLVHPGGPLPLADALPLFESLDLRAIEEQPFHLRPKSLQGSPARAVLHVFSLEAGTELEESRFPALLEALAALQEGRAEVDGFNRLVARAGLAWREAWLLRALFRWLKQVGFAFAQGSVEAALAAHPRAARLLVDLFHARFDPAPSAGAASAEAEAALTTEWAALIEAVEDPDTDRILARLRTALDAVLRTNFFQDKPYLALKIDSAAAGEMPLPRPWREIFVHAPHMEGCHLRAGPVARGGIRWSDRREDFRTEILGLMKAQRLKNVVIVPTGAKGGFVLKGSVPPATEREAFMATGIAAYKTLIRGMLDVTDNLKGEAVVPPPQVVRRDGDDPYIVAAADKGTATFSDIANGLAREYGFWLDDAFASGGSQGYDHKAMGITAKGAWVMIARHFSELGHDIQAAPFTMVGVGDMSGDVFGNGLLVSRQTKLLAAFDHRHIFIDPEPDLAASYEERARLFALPRSSWADYNPEVISAGGGVYPRNARSVPLSPAARALLGIEAEKPDPATVMKAILRAPVDLLYFGGIGTYVKAASETQAEAGDRANDAIRVDGREIRARILGEGANLGVTQAGRIEAARLGAQGQSQGQGVKLNTDALDNSAGVSTSDHEVNIKILLADARASGALTERQRDALLVAMTEEVAALVLRDNAQQSLAISLEAEAGAEALPAQAMLMARLEASGLLDRAVAGLPDAASLEARAAAGEGLTRPELSALLPFAKLWLAEAIEHSSLPDDPALLPLLEGYFPSALRRDFAPYIARHRLRRELLATILANEVANRMGPAGLARLASGTGPAEAARAVILAERLLGLGARMDEADTAAAPAATRHAALQALRHLLAATAQGLLGLPETALPLAEALGALNSGIAGLLAAETSAATPEAEGLPEAVARLVAAAPALEAAPAIVRLATAAGVAPERAAAAWREVGEAFSLPALRQAAQKATANGPFGPRAKAALLEDLALAQARLATAALKGTLPEAEATRRLAQEAASRPDLAAVSVAAREIGRVV